MAEFAKPRFIETDQRYCVNIAELVRWWQNEAPEKVHGVPDTFRKCYLCPDPAVQIVCFHTTDPISNFEYDDPEAQFLADLLRLKFRTNVEIPTCSLHRDGCPQVM